MAWKTKCGEVEENEKYQYNFVYDIDKFFKCADTKRIFRSIVVEEEEEEKTTEYNIEDTKQEKCQVSHLRFKKMKINNK